LTTVITSTRSDPRPDRFLKGALVFTLLAHGAGMVSMPLLLMPGVPGGGQGDVGARALHVASHPWPWRLGWLPWQLTALSDLLLGVALVGTAWIPRRAAVLALAATVLGVVFDQTGQFLWTWPGVLEAEHAVASGDTGAYARFESTVFRLTAGFGPIGYIAGAVGWTWCFARAGVGSHRLVWVGVTAWALFVIGTGAMLLPESLRPGAWGASGAAIVSLANGAAFVFLMLWLMGITEGVFGRGRPLAEYGGDAPWRHPAGFPIAPVSNVIANSRALGELGRCVPGVAMASDITDVVYVSYLVEADRLERLVQPGLALQRLGPGGGYALFTFLTFRHGHFGPECFGRWRRLWPSPIQSNWRIYVFNPRTGVRGVQFLTTAITSTPHALVTRLLTDGVPMHVPRSAMLRRDARGAIELGIEPGRGTAPEVRARFVPAPEPPLEHPWDLCFSSWGQFLGYCVPQDRALTVVPGRGRVVRQEIELGIPLDSCRALTGEVDSTLARTVAGESRPLCFLVERVRFRFAGQEPDLARDFEIE
jgi:hypothetical protein